MNLCLDRDEAAAGWRCSPRKATVFGADYYERRGSAGLPGQVGRRLAYAPYAPYAPYATPGRSNLRRAVDVVCGRRMMVARIRRPG